MKLRGWLLLACCGVASPVMAGTLYRCMGADGVPNYSSKRVSNAVCKVMSQGPQRVSVSPRTPARPTPDKPTAVASLPVPPVAATAAVVAKSQATDKHVVFRTVAAGGVLTAATASVGAHVTRGAVYKFEQDGITHYTNIRPRGATRAQVLFSYIEACYACSSLPGVNFRAVALNTADYQSEISSAALQYGVEEAVVRAIIHAESAFHVNARSNKGAQGLMQLIPATAARFGVADPYDPAQNIRGGVAYLSWLMQRYSSNLRLVAAAYNAGEGAVDRNGGVPPYSETQRYVERVGQLADRYRTALSSR